RQLDVDQARLRLHETVRHRLALEAERLRGLERQLAALSPREVLARGYALVEAVPPARPIRSVAQVVGGAQLTVHVADGAFGVVADAVRAGAADALVRDG